LIFGFLEELDTQNISDELEAAIRAALDARAKELG
jgi:hypothetical protein